MDCEQETAGQGSARHGVTDTDFSASQAKDPQEDKERKLQAAAFFVFLPMADQEDPAPRGEGQSPL